MKAMVFRNYGGIYQLRIESADDLALIHDLQPARWAATSVPAEILQCDPVFLEYLNGNGNGRIRREHLRTAVKWVFRMISDRRRLTASSDILRLADLDTRHDAGRKLEEATRHILEQQNAERSDEISLEQVRAFRKTYALTSPNGDGVLPPGQILDPAATRLAKDVLEQVGGIEDLSGAAGITEDHLSEFLDREKKFLTWKARGEGDGATELVPWGDDTPAAAALASDLDARIEQFFRLCDLVRLDLRVAERTGLTDEDLQELDHSDPETIERMLAESPLQPPNAEGALDLRGAINPHDQARMSELEHRVLARALPDLTGHLTRTTWRQVKAVFEPYNAWQEEKPPGGVDEAKLKEYLSGPAEETLRRLLREDRSVKAEVEQTSNLEKLILYQRWLPELANNFVSFPALYDSERRALFEMGDLVIDGRQLAFAVKVRNRAEHKAIAATSKMFLVYAEISEREDQGSSFEIAAPVTSGCKGGIEIGKRGVFYDLRGKEWDARVVDIIENPISLVEAIKAPFVKVKDLVARKSEQFAASSAQALEKVTTEVTTKMEKGESFQPATTAPVVAAAPKSTSGLRDLLMGGGIAFAAIGSSLAYLIKTLSQVSLLNAGLALLSIVGVVALFSALAGWNKLRRRDMSAILEACGWAVNFRMLMTHRLGHLFTRTPQLPKGARRERLERIGLFLRQAGYGASRWSRVALISLLAVVLIVVVLGASFWSEVGALLLTWLK